jgi:hypothetical protein
MMKNADAFLTKAAYLYLAFPFLIFTISWLNTLSAIVFTLISCASLYWALQENSYQSEIGNEIINNRKSIFWGIALLIFVLFFSGIGSYSYQNFDHLYRNALFRDLVNFKWPVMYQVKGFGHHALEGKTAMMTYYLGYYLPAAAVGKLLGYNAAKFALFLWSAIGGLLVIYQMGKYLNKFNFKVFLLFFGWGTLFYMGAFYKYPLKGVLFDTDNHWLWAGMRLYADSNLGNIYWTFNQSFPSWLVILLLFNNIPKKNLVFVYSFCFFLSPFAFVGLLPFVIYLIIKKMEGSKWSLKNWLNTLKSYLSFQNIAGAGVVAILNLLYLSTNQAGQSFHILQNPSLKVFFAFMMLSWGSIVVFIFPKFKTDSLLWLIVAILLPLPFFQQGNGIDFPGRISIPALFLLMLLVGKFLIEEKKGRLRSAVLGYMILSAIGHFGFEVGKSMAITLFENVSHRTNLDQRFLKSDSPYLQKLGKELYKTKRRNICLKDDYGTVLNPKNEVIWNYMADIEHSKFYSWFAKKP